MYSLIISIIYHQREAWGWMVWGTLMGWLALVFFWLSSTEFCNFSSKGMTWDSGFLLSWGARKRAQIQESIDCNIMKCTHTQKAGPGHFWFNFNYFFPLFSISCDMLLIFWLFSFLTLLLRSPLAVDSCLSGYYYLWKPNLRMIPPHEYTMLSLLIRPSKEMSY